MGIGFVLLTEDGEGSYRVLEELVVKMLLLIDPQVDPRRLSFSPADDVARRAMAFNGWKERSGIGHQKRVALARTIATRLRPEDRQFIMVHVDGDIPFKASAGGTRGENVERFAEIRAAVKVLLEDHGRTSLLSRLFLLVPYHSIESWYYQNTDEALRICHEHRPQDSRAIGWFHYWREHPELLDEEESAPKDRVWLVSRFNDRLVRRGYPTSRVLALGLSFAIAVHTLLNNSELVGALEELRYNGQ